jgi:putative toxin-antitoxin system antitoxin component (TIGR02293 family)
MTKKSTPTGPNQKPYNTQQKGFRFWEVPDEAPDTYNALEDDTLPYGLQAHSDIGHSVGSYRYISQMTPFEKMWLAQKGISKTGLEQLKNTAALDYDQLAGALAVTRATLINKKGAARFSSGLSEKIIGLADIYSYGYEVFDNEASFNAWVFRPNKALGGQTPYALLNNQFGREAIKSLIGRIAYGVYS